MFSKHRQGSDQDGGPNIKQLLRDKVRKSLDNSQNSERWFLDLKGLVQNDHAYASLNVMTVTGSTLKWLVITKSSVEKDPGDLPQLQICSDKSYKLKVYSKTINEGSFSGDSAVDDVEVKCTLNQLIESNYCVCPGIQNYEDYYEKIRYHSKHVRQWTHLERVDADNCMLWHKEKFRRNKEYMGLCDSCVTLKQRLNELLQNAVKVDTPEKLKRQRPDSNMPLKYMSPQSQKKRKQRQDQERKDLKTFLRKIKGTDIELDESQNSQMIQISQLISDNFRNDLNELIAETSELSEKKREELHQIWDLDSKSREDFAEDQTRNVNGSRGNKWNMITYRMALAVYIRSPAAYKALKSFDILSLPSQRSLRKFMSHKMDEAGDCENHLHEQKAKYEKMCEELREEDKPCPDGFGALIFDEVKVISKVLWNASNNTLIGYAMTHEEMFGLHDIYMNLDTAPRLRKTNYILQFLWRDICSPFDVLGPYYTSENSLEHKFIITCVLDALYKFHQFGFKTKVIICDGASSNLTTIKHFMGHKGVFGHNEDQQNNITHVISPKCYNPLTGEFMFFIICPTHQLKNMISQLYASRNSGTKAFEKDSIPFGWKPIQDLYREDLARAQQGNALRVPDLKLTYVIRDSWTRLNVKPAKVMQQRPLIATLQVMADEIQNQAARDSVNMTASFLESCNSIFENGLLSNYHISQNHQVGLANRTAKQARWLSSHGVTSKTIPCLANMGSPESVCLWVP